MSDQILKPTFTITVGEEEFVLRVPTPLERARLGVREAAVRRMLDPTVAVDPSQLDAETWCLVRGMAVLEQLLEKVNVKWPYTEGRNGKGEPELIVDITKFPIGKEDVIGEVGAQFQSTLDRFHREGAGHPRPAISETVAGSGNPGSL